MTIREGGHVDAGLCKARRFFSFSMRVFAVPILRDRWAYYCHSTLPSTSRLSRAVEWSSKKWEQLGEAEPKTWKRRLYDSGTHLMNQLDYQEWFLKNVPMKEEVAGAVEKVLR